MSETQPIWPSPPARNRVAVIGQGLQGVASLKNLREQGFDAVGIERNGHIGGLWQWSTDTSQITVLKSTTANTSKNFGCYQDFPFPEGTPNYPKAPDVASYVRSYAAHFDLLPHIRLNTKISRVSPAPEDEGGWVLTLTDAEGTREEKFDRVLVATGPHADLLIPSIPGIDKFKGEVIHAAAYKDPAALAGKRVFIIGSSNTGCDIAHELVGVAKTIYASHRTGIRLVGRLADGKPADTIVTRRFVQIGKIIKALFPSSSSLLLERTVESHMKKQCDLDPEWKLLPAPPMINSSPVINDYFMSHLKAGEVKSVTGTKGFTETTVITDEGEWEVDVVILATSGYFDYSILSEEADPTAGSKPEWEKKETTNGLAFPRLYQSLFHPAHADTLAFIGPCRGHSFSAFSNGDLSSQAIAQVWKGAYTLPPRATMEKWCDKNYKTTLGLIKAWHIQRTGPGDDFEHWLNEVVGNKVNEKLGWGWEGWKFWWNERELQRLIMNGINSPHVYRLFDGREGSRKKWEGAREAIYRINGKEWKQATEEQVTAAA